MSAEASLPPPIDALQSLGQLEDAREQLHTALREAAFQFSITRHLEEQRGHLLGFEAVPIAPGSLSPSCHVERCIDRGNDDEDSKGDGDPDEESSAGHAFWRLVVEDGAAAHPAPSPSTDDEHSQPPVTDALLCFSAAPSHDLRECQRLYREVLRLAVRTVTAQEDVLRSI